LAITAPSEASNPAKFSRIDVEYAVQCAIDNRRARLPAAIGASLECTRPPVGVPAWFTGTVALGLALGGCAVAHATGYAVTGNGDPGTGGLSLRQAITMANAGPGNIVYFDPALNGSTITLTQGAIPITNSTTVLGPGADKLTISGGNNSGIFYDFVLIAPPAPTITISGLTLTAGKAGFGAIAVATATLNLQDCVVTGNTTTNAHGAAVYISSGEITDSTISNNSGGGIYSSGQSLNIARTKVSGNSVSSAGAGVYARGTALTISNSTITGNSAGGNGGGIFITDGNSGSPTASLTLSQSNVSGNSAYYFGAGIDVKHANTVYISQSLISQNVLTSFAGTGYGGGGLALHSVSSSTYISNSTFYRNFAYHNGGGIGIFDATTGSGVSIKFSTISGNSTAYSYSNGILGVGKPLIYASIVANNSSRFYTQDMVGTFYVARSLVKNANGTTITTLGALPNIFGVDPQLGPLTVNGGPTLTMLPAATSPVLNAGLLFPVEGTDQRGLTRVVGSSADMGAVERQVPEIIIFRNGFDSS
jgi:hypothetical protein